MNICYSQQHDSLEICGLERDHPGRHRWEGARRRLTQSEVDCWPKSALWREWESLIRHTEEDALDADEMRLLGMVSLAIGNEKGI